MRRVFCLLAAAALSLACALCVAGCDVVEVDLGGGNTGNSGIASGGAGSSSLGGSSANANAGSSSNTASADGMQANVRPQTQRDYYKFRNNNTWKSHYEKHGIEMGFKDKQEYLDAANAVIDNPDTLHKFEAEDHDDVYFLDATQEFVVVSGDGYIRTYYNASRAYFDRQ